LEVIGGFFLSRKCFDLLLAPLSGLFVGGLVLPPGLFPMKPMGKWVYMAHLLGYLGSKVAVASQP